MKKGRRATKRIKMRFEKRVNMGKMESSGNGRQEKKEEHSYYFSSWRIKQNNGTEIIFKIIFKIIF